MLGLISLITERNGGSSSHGTAPAVILKYLLVIFVFVVPVSAEADHERVTRVVRLEHVEIQRALELYPKLVGSTGTIEVSASQNAVIIHDFPESIRRFERILAILDVPHGTTLRIYVRPILYRQPEELVSLVSAVWESKSGPAPRFVADDRTGQLIVVASAESYRKLDRLLRRLDVPERDSGRGLWIEPSPPGDLPPLGSSSKKP